MMRDYQNTIFHQFGNFLKNTFRVAKGEFKKIPSLIKSATLIITHHHTKTS